MSDRIAGAVLILLAIGYLALASSYTAVFFSDPLGARFVPGGIGLFLLGSAIALMTRPADRASWPDRGTWASLAIALAGFIAYVLILEPLGFVISTTLVFTLFARLFDAPSWKGFATGVVFSVVLYFLFVRALSLYLPFGDLLEGFL